MKASMVTMAPTLDGHAIDETLGIVRGIIVRSRSVIGVLGARIQTIFGGNITVYTTMCEQARADAFAQMIEHAELLGGNAIISVRYDTTEIMPGVTEVLCYGTAIRARLALTSAPSAA